MKKLKSLIYSKMIRSLRDNILLEKVRHCYINSSKVRSFCLLNTSICLFIFQFTGLQSIHAQSLQEYLVEAANNNKGLQSSYKEFEAVLAQLSQVKSLPNPTLSMGVFISPVETRVGPQQGKLSLSQMFPWFGTLKAREKVVTHLAEVKYEAFLEEKDELFFKVKSAYYPLYELKQKIKWQEENLEILKSYKKLATTSFSNSKGTLADVIRVDLMIDEADNEIKIMQAEMRPLLSAFNVLLNKNNLTDSVHIPETISLLPTENNYRKDSLITNNPKLEQIEKQLLVLNAKEEVITKDGMPKIGVGLDYVFVGKRTDMNVADNGKNALMPMVSVSLPVFRNKYKAATNEIKLKKEALSLKKEYATTNLSSMYEMAWFKLEKARQLYELYDNQITKTRQVVNLLSTAYSNSGKELDEILKMQQQLLKYKVLKATAVKDFYVTLARLDRLTSKNEF